MNSDHWILLGGWLLFGLLHSLMAAIWFRDIVRPVMGRRFVYYRLIYSTVALLSLAGVLAWQFSITSVRVVAFPVLKWVIGLPLGELGIFLMCDSIRKYFFKLSGVSVFWEKKEQPSLEVGGTHRYVRHPLYIGTLLLVWSLFLFFPWLSNLLACGMITLYTLAGIQLEERKLLRQFGQPYADYRRKVPMLIPGTKPGSGSSRRLRSGLNR
jgi:protein-S-isoprenylcysteine O-methyltransferase Ste14